MHISLYYITILHGCDNNKVDTTFYPSQFFRSLLFYMESDMISIIKSGIEDLP